jgi:mannose-6-phosphate isomerase-like protein (cupin superfamily)
MGEAFWFLGTRMELKASGATTGGAFGLIEQELPAGFAPPPHVDRSEDEAFYVLEGELTVTRGAETVAAPAGTCVFLPRGVPHAFRVGAAPARLLQLNTPAGLERFFAEAGEPARGPGLPPGPPDVGRLLALAPAYGVEILGPPPGQPAAEVGA